MIHLLFTLTLFITYYLHFPIGYLSIVFVSSYTTNIFTQEYSA